MYTYNKTLVSAVIMSVLSVYSFAYMLSANSLSELPVIKKTDDNITEKTQSNLVKNIISPDVQLASSTVKEIQKIKEEPAKEIKPIIVPAIISQTKSFFDVPFFSQFDDISSANWKKIGCGIVSLGMIIDYYKPGEIYIDTLLNEGINSGAYITNAGWSHKGLALLADKYGLVGLTFDFSASSMEVAFAKFEKAVKEGPVIASVHYTFDPSNPIPHLAVINGIKGDILYYSDPAEGQGTISVEKFKKAWKKRYITVRSNNT